MEKQTATIAYLRNAARRLEAAAEELEAQGSYHLERARQQVELAVADAQLCVRKIDRARAERNALLLAEQARERMSRGR